MMMTLSTKTYRHVSTAHLPVPRSLGTPRLGPPPDRPFQVLRFWPARPGPGATEESIILKGLIVSSRPMREPHRTHKAGRGKLPPSTKPGLSRLQVLTAHVCSRPHPTLYHCTPHAPDVREPRMFRATYSTNTTCDIHPKSLQPHLF